MSKKYYEASLIQIGPRAAEMCDFICKWAYFIFFQLTEFCGRDNGPILLICNTNPPQYGKEYVLYEARK